MTRDGKMAVVLGIGGGLVILGMLVYMCFGNQIAAGRERARVARDAQIIAAAKARADAQAARAAAEAEFLQQAQARAAEQAGWAKAHEPTPADRLISAVRLSCRRRMTVSMIGGVMGFVEVEFAVQDNLTLGLTKHGAKKDVRDILKGASDAQIPFLHIHIKGTYPLVDGFGNVTQTPVLDLSYLQATVARIDWANFLTEDVYAIADLARIHPTFQ